MVIIKIDAGTTQEREIEIVNEKGNWGNGSYHLFEAHFIHNGDKPTPEPHDINSPNYAGEIIVDKDKGYWEYKGDKLSNDAQKQAALFILDYSAPDGVY
ncbi:MAG: hypothetical protein ACXVJD_16490 [Mucilaginibacter sp.]